MDGSMTPTTSVAILSLLQLAPAEDAALSPLGPVAAQQASPSRTLPGPTAPVVETGKG